MNVVVTGSLGFDYIMDFPGRFADRIMSENVHKISLSFLVDTLKKNFGGTAGNFAYTAKLLGLEPLLLTSAGNDFVPYAEYFQRLNISTTYIDVLPDIPTGTYFGVTDRDDNQIGAYYGGPLRHNEDVSIGSVKDHIDFVHISPDNPKAMTRHVAECRDMKLKYMYDPAFQIGDFSPGELRAGIEGAEILIGNDYEIDLMLDKLAITHEDLRVMVPVVVTTLGAKGSVVETRRESIHIKPAKPKNASDPTGAGDAYRAGFVAGYMRGFDLVTCGRMGSVAAVYTVEKYGTQTHKFTKQQFIKRFSENFGTTLQW